MPPFSVVPINDREAWLSDVLRKLLGHPDGGSLHVIGFWMTDSSAGFAEQCPGQLELPVVYSSEVMD